MEQVFGAEELAQTSQGPWVFAYGSLMWDPGFERLEHVRACLHGYRRRFCLRSMVHRGTPARPGLVLGLDPDADSSCEGIALRVCPEAWLEVLAALRKRELVTDAYREAVMPLALTDGRVVHAVSYVMQTDHAQYAPPMSLDEQLGIIMAATGGRGPNRDYLLNTADHLQAQGIEDAEINELARMLRACQR